jgi:SAM-dependent methyltransferase
VVDKKLKLYNDLAKWWPLFSPPSEYVEEAEDLLPALLAAPDAPPKTLLELGSGGGSLAFHLKGALSLTLTDLSEDMLAVSRAVNPECEHLQGDMRTLDLGREFDLVLVHDAIMYATDEAMLAQVIATAYRHVRPGGAALLLPDFVKETFEPGSEHDGEDAPDGRGMRWLEWSWDPDPGDHTFETAYSYILREPDGSVTFEGETHVEGLFPRNTWLRLIRGAGFEVTSRIDPWNREVFACKRSR